MSKFDFDLIIIGSGTAGAAAAFAAKKAGLKVAIAENSAWGGLALNSRDLPFCSAKTFFSLYHDAIAGSRFGLSSKTLRFNFPTFKKWLELSKKRSGANSKKSFEDAGITCLKGIAHFLSPYELSVGEETFSAKKFIIASGSVLNQGGIIGLESVKCLTADTALDLKALPKTMTIIGGGATGCEFAEFFATLGVKVQIIELSPRLLPREDVEAGSVLQTYLEEEFKVKVLTEARVLAVSNFKNNTTKISFLRGGVEKASKSEAVFLATGALPNLDLGLENAGVKFDKNGIKTDEFLQTSMKHIYAVGDCLGKESSSERAAYEGTAALLNLVKKEKNSLNYEIFPRVVNTNPEIVSLGKTEIECRSSKLKYEKIFVPISEIPASNTNDFRVGFLKLLVDKKKKTLLGATLMSKNADLMVSELSLIMKNNLPVTELAKIPHVSTSFSELLHIAAEKA